jgi:hypothetical protein
MYDYRASSSGGDTAMAGWDADRQSERSIIVPCEHGQIMKTDTVVVRSDVLDDVEKGALSWKSTFRWWTSHRLFIDKNRIGSTLKVNNDPQILPKTTRLIHPGYAEKQ